MKKLLIQGVLFLAYIPFAGRSAWMTAESFHLNVLSDMPFWLVFTMIFIVALLAGYFLNRAIREPMRPNPSRGLFACYILAFLFYWGISFMTNVHYNYVLQHGYGNLSAQVHSCIDYLNTNIYNNDAVFDSKKEERKIKLAEQVNNKMEVFVKYLNDTRDGKDGFGNDCVTALTSIEQIFNGDAKIFEDTNDYTVFDKKTDSGDVGKNKYRNKTYLQEKYQKRVEGFLKKRYDVIDRHYENQKGNNAKLKETLALANKIAKEGLPQIEKSKDFKNYSDCYNKNIQELLKQMPSEYLTTTVKSNKSHKGSKEMESYIVYPSERMFDWLTVWGDWWNDRLPENDNFKSGMPSALLWDVTAFILISMI